MRADSLHFGVETARLRERFLVCFRDESVPFASGRALSEPGAAARRAKGYADVGREVVTNFETRSQAE